MTQLVIPELEPGMRVRATYGQIDKNNFSVLVYEGEFQSFDGVRMTLKKQTSYSKKFSYISFEIAGLTLEFFHKEPKKEKKDPAP